MKTKNWPKRLYRVWFERHSPKSGQVELVSFDCRVAHPSMGRAQARYRTGFIRIVRIMPIREVTEQDRKIAEELAPVARLLITRS